MAVSSAFGALTELIEQFEATNREVLGVVTEDIGSGDDDSLAVDLTVRTPLFGDVDTDEIEFTARSASVNEDGTATVDLAVSIPRSIRSESTVRRHGRGGIKDGTRGSTGTADRRRNGDVPVHRDPDRLREVYAACDTFAEMTEALGADVTSVTVRRNMIKHGIHEPRSNGSSSAQDDGGAGEVGDSNAGSDDEVDADTTTNGVSDGDGDVDGSDHASLDTADSFTDDPPADDATARGDVPDDDADSTLDDEPVTTEETSSEPADEVVAIPDGIGFPHDLTLDQLTAVVSTSKTLHEAGTRLGLDRDRTRELLDDLGVLDLVHGRVSTRHERAASPEEVDERIRERLSRSTGPVSY